MYHNVSFHSHSMLCVQADHRCALLRVPCQCLQVKTGNMLLDGHLECRIADFGYAKLHQTQLRKAEARGEPLSADAGTYQYMVREPGAASARLVAGACIRCRTLEAGPCSIFALPSDWKEWQGHLCSTWWGGLAMCCLGMECLCPLLAWRLILAGPPSGWRRGGSGPLLPAHPMRGSAGVHPFQLAGM